MDYKYDNIICTHQFKLLPPDCSKYTNRQRTRLPVAFIRFIPFETKTKYKSFAKTNNASVHGVSNV